MTMSIVNATAVVKHIINQYNNSSSTLPAFSTCVFTTN